MHKDIGAETVNCWEGAAWRRGAAFFLAARGHVLTIAVSNRARVNNPTAGVQ